MNTAFVVKKELQRCFSSPWGWLLTSIFWLVTGFYVAEILLGTQGVIAQLEASEQAGLAIGSLDITELLLNSLFDFLGTLSWWVIALLSLDLDWQGVKYSRNYSRLQTALNPSLLVWGKLLARVSYFIFLLVPVVIYEIMIFVATEPKVSPVVPLLAHGGLIFLVAIIFSWHMAIAACIKQRFYLFLASCSLFTSFWLLDFLSDRTGDKTVLLEHFSLFTSYRYLTRGIISVGNVVMMLSYLLMAIFFTSQISKLAFFSTKNNN